MREIRETRIRDMRSSLAMTQEEFAQALGTTVSTVNRRENGHSNPSKLARATISRLANLSAVAKGRLDTP